MKAGIIARARENVFFGEVSLSRALIRIGGEYPDGDGDSCSPAR